MKSLLIGFLILFVSLFAFFLYIIFSSIENPQQNKVVDRTNAQILEVTARGGYSPELINATANKPTILRVKTLNTFDCSSSLVIPSLNIQKMLPANGKTDIDLGSFEPGKTLNGTCGMGMYNFSIKFN